MEVTETPTNPPCGVRTQEKVTIHHNSSRETPDFWGNYTNARKSHRKKHAVTHSDLLPLGTIRIIKVKLRVAVKLCFTKEIITNLPESYISIHTRLSILLSHALMMITN